MGGTNEDVRVDGAHGGKFIWRFVLLENVNMEGISLVWRDGELTVMAQKKPLPEPKKIKVKSGEDLDHLN